MESELMEECPVCFTQKVCVESSLCGHLGCRDCLHQWMEHCEKTGREATCFTCREVMSVGDVRKVLGRGMEIRSLHSDGNTDDLTIDWMVQNGVKQCPWCGIWVERVDGCCYMRCFCQETFCFDCGLKIETEDHEVDRCRCFLDRFEAVFHDHAARLRCLLDALAREQEIRWRDEGFLVGDTLDALRAMEQAKRRAAKKLNCRLRVPQRNQKNKYERRKNTGKDMRRNLFKGR